MKIIVGLGNPGRKYSRNRHNIGIILGSYFAKNFNIRVKQKEFSSLTGTGKIDGEEIFIQFPETFMNNSGVAVKSALQYYREKPENIIVIHDEIELQFGTFKTKFGGGHKGHNGIRSIMEHLGTPDFHRVRFGVGRPDNPEISVADYVLTNFTAEEFLRIEEMAPAVTDAILAMITT